MPVDRSRIKALREWMCEGAPPSADGRTIVADICTRLNEAGVAVDRFALFLFTIHPTIKGRRLAWSQDKGASIVEAGFALFDTDEYHTNPLPHVMKSRRSIRRKLSDPECPHDYKIVGELIADGFTDYLVQPVIYIDGEVNTMSWSSRREGGFSTEAIDALEWIRAPMTRLIESYVLRLNAANIISTYAGRNAGERILKGNIKRGDTEEIEAVILFADLKGFTSLSNSQPAGEVVAHLNRFFDTLEEPIIAAKGEILKFMGDGVLAIFPVRTTEHKRVAQAAHDCVLSAARALTGDRTGDMTGDMVGGKNVPFRSALHIGRFHYGNIGASRRLDFTAIGADVNFTARLLSAAPTLGSDHVCSQAVADLLDVTPDLAGETELKGFAGAWPVYRIG